MKIIGDYPPIERRTTGLYTFDRAVGNPFKEAWGMPLRSMYEIYGASSSGKSTLSYFLAGKVNPTGEIDIADIEGLDLKYLELAIGASGFEGTLKVISEYDDKGKPRYHGAMLTELAMRLAEEADAGIFDSVSSYASAAEEEGTIGEAHMGRRAKDMAQFVRKARRRLLYAEAPGALFFINHKYNNLGSAGHTTAGGEEPKNLAAVRIWLYRKESHIIKTSDFDDFYAEGRVMKLRYGGGGRKFGVFFLAGQGVHPGMTAVFDCFRLGLAERGATVKLNGKSQGRISELVESARAGETDKFEPFHKALDKFTGEIKGDEEDGDET
jgi:RecA/RadA recombinase